MAVGLQLVGLVLGVLSWCLQSSSTSSHTWKTKSHMEAVTTSQWQFEGLWMSCAATALGSVQCSKFKTVLGLSGERLLPPPPGEFLTFCRTGRVLLSSDQSDHLNRRV